MILQCEKCGCGAHVTIRPIDDHADDKHPDALAAHFPCCGTVVRLELSSGKEITNFRPKLSELAKESGSDFMRYMQGDSDALPAMYPQGPAGGMIVKGICDLISADHENASGTTYQFGHYKMLFVLAFTLQNGRHPTYGEFETFCKSEQMWPNGMPCRVMERAFRSIIGCVTGFTMRQELS